MEHKRKVLFFISPEVGGAERMTITIAKMLDVGQYDVKFVVVGHNLGNIERFIPSHNPIILLKIRNIFDFVVFRLYLLMKKEKPDVVFCSLIYLNIRVTLAAKLHKNIKIIVRSNIGLSNLVKLNYLLSKLTYPMADVVIAQQEEMRNEILYKFKMNPLRVVALHNPIDVKTICQKADKPSPFLEGDNVKYVWVGRISYEKGQDILIQAFHKVLQRIPNAELYLIGKYMDNSQYYQSLRKLVDQFNLKNNITFVGFDANPYRWIKHCDCFVQPSRLEGLPNALIEAMYLGVPVVATRCIPVVDRIVKNGYNGIIVNTEDIDGLEEAMIKAIKLTNFHMTYHSASEKEFTELFN